MQVALLTEGVDRNSVDQAAIIRMTTVALLTEGVDRNTYNGSQPYAQNVALLTEGVDRNCNTFHVSFEPYRSPSSRRAWIEIHSSFGCSLSYFVALLTEGVDRNF